MNVKELRLGNIIYIYWKNALGKRTAVVDLGAIMDLATNGTGSAYYYEPIPLTEKWLLKFGFKGQPIDYTKNKLSVTLEGSCNFHKKGRVYFNSWVILEEQPKYVHQLQNLYFALTGQELEVQSV